MTTKTTVYLSGKEVVRALRNAPPRIADIAEKFCAGQVWQPVEMTVEEEREIFQWLGEDPQRRK